MAKIREERWTAIRTEYITCPDSSLRDLAVKYGVSRSAIEVKSRKEGWYAQRTQHNKKVDEEIIRKEEEGTIEHIANRKAERIINLIITAEKLRQIVDDIIERSGDKLTPGIIESLTRSLKNIKDIQGAKDAMDAREQLARILALEKQLNATDEGDKQIRVVIEGDADLAK